MSASDVIDEVAEPCYRVGVTSLVAAWGALTVLALLVKAFIVLAPLAARALGEPLTPVQIVFVVGWTAFMVVSEGYRGFQRSFSPRVVARAFQMGVERRPLDIVLAPFYCIGLYRAPRRTMIVAWAVTLGVVALVIAVGALPQPWRGLVDVGVIAGLGWGAVSIIWFFARALARPVSEK